KRHEVTVPLPERQLQDFIPLDPRQRSLAILRQGRAGPGVDHEDEAEPILAVLAEARPADGAAQPQRLALDAGLFANLAPHAGDDVLARLQLAAEPIVFAEVRVVGAGVA